MNGVGGPGFRFRGYERLKQNEGIRKVFKLGRAYSCPGAKLFVMKSGLAYNRIGFTLARKFGNAPARNRAKRLGREAYRLLRPRLAAGFDLVLLVYPPPAAAKSLRSSASEGLGSRMDQFTVLCARAGLFLNGS
ncbi:MAG: ribonuclease P protein component [Treponema sp.]|nr:ribonuclease P protein component [Treponema sp.]